MLPRYHGFSDSATDISRKIGHQVLQLVLVQKLVTLFWGEFWNLRGRVGPPILKTSISFCSPISTAKRGGGVPYHVWCWYKHAQ